MKNQKKTAVFLRMLTMKESNEIFQLSKGGIIFGNFLQDLQLQEEKPVEFTQRLLWLTKGFYSIRLHHEPEKIVGYTLFYKSGESFYDSLCILPDYYHPGIINQTREQMAELAKFCYGLKDIAPLLIGTSISTPRSPCSVIHLSSSEAYCLINSRYSGFSAKFSNS